MLAMEGGGDTLSLLTGVGGALSARGRDIPKNKTDKRAEPKSVSAHGGGGGGDCVQAENLKRQKMI